MNKMDLIKVESNWTESSPLQKLLTITDKEDDCTNTDQNDQPITLTQPNTKTTTTNTVPNDTCHISLDCHRLQGQYPISVSLISGARNVECYVGQDSVYMGTTRGTFITLSDSDREKYNRLYCCIVDLSSEHTSIIKLKLPSLKGSGKVMLNKISVTLSDVNEGGVSNNNTSITTTNNGVFQPAQLDDVFSILHNSDNIPPFMSTLITALKTSSVSSDNVGDISAMFRQIRKQDTTPSEETIPCEEEVPVSDNKMANEQNDNNMEGRITRYIDEKLLELRLHIDNQLKLMKQEIINEINKK